MKYLIKLLILSTIAGILLAVICRVNNIPLEYKRAVLQVYILGMFVGGIGWNLK
ncbi:hypothetical protein [Clostridium cuniculi]|uniref:hypothetical protein n=1 Tax=Clostridium cuniculi TaxID=2548455 RepID=UPI00140FB9E4|nr:hypothetical protein [Clostridium cuniculi]